MTSSTATEPTTTPPHTNRLAAETSPYLLQHQHNPVDWYPWGEEAFRAAREQNKPIFLSVGYSTCYWCHVMERQCFEVESIAQEMNRRFINIKVDREERPDVDQLYMTAVQVMTRHGGWPMSVWLTPDLRPFYGGTYFPPEDMPGPNGGPGRPGFPRLLAALDDAWQNRREEIGGTADQLLSVLHQLATPRAPEADLRLDDTKLHEYIARSASDYEPVHGGFGRAPKFPRQTLLRLLLTYIDGPARRDPQLTKRVRDMLRHTLDCMDRGGIHDHLGGGFHRYSTDGIWLVPHFEVMLYDQAMLAEVYATASRVVAGGQTETSHRFAEVARGICDFVFREMTSPDGAFYTAMDAEVDGQEGLNYLWTAAEIAELLGPEDAALFGCVYGVDQGPNFADPHHPPASGRPEKNILFLDRPLDAAAHDHGLSVPELAARLSAARAKLKSARDARKQPLLDTKILTGWNALMAQALVTVGQELSEPKYLAAAARNCHWLLAKHRTPDGGLYRSSRNGTPRYAGFLDDYAGLALACLSAGRATSDTSLLEAGQDLARQTLRRFGRGDAESAPSTDSSAPTPLDDRRGGCGKTGCKGGSGGSCSTCGGGGALFFSDAGADDLIVRQKVATDSPLPSGNAQAARLLLALHALAQPRIPAGLVPDDDDDSETPVRPAMLPTPFADRAAELFTDLAQAIDDNAESTSALVEALTLYVRQVGPLEVAARTPAPGTAQAPASPEELARQVVAVDARFADELELQVRVSIAPGYHIHAADLATEGFIATRLTIDNGEVLHPAPDKVRLAFAPEELEVYQGQVVFTVRFDAKPDTVIRGTLVYQPCDDTSCLPPVTRPIEIYL